MGPQLVEKNFVMIPTAGLDCTNRDYLVGNPMVRITMVILDAVEYCSAPEHSPPEAC